MLYNELDFSRQQNGEKKQPDYILVFKKDGQILNIDVDISSRKDLGRPTTTPNENKNEFKKRLGL